MCSLCVPDVFLIEGLRTQLEASKHAVSSVFLMCSQCVPNVFLIEGLRTQLEASKHAVSSVFLMCSQCVPNAFHGLRTQLEASKHARKQADDNFASALDKVQEHFCILCVFCLSFSILPPPSTRCTILQALLDANLPGALAPVYVRTHVRHTLDTR
jgi:hypothetical protein